MTIPTPVPWKLLERARAEHERLSGDYDASFVRVRQLEQERAAAAEADRAALAAALTAGKSDPGDKELERVEKLLAAEQRKVDALQLATQQAQARIEAVVEEHREEWKRDAERRVDEARSGYAAAVEALVAAREQLEHAFALASFTENFPNGKTIGRLPFAGGEVGLNGARRPFPEIARHLREDAERAGKPRPRLAAPAPLQPVGSEAA